MRSNNNCHKKFYSFPMKKKNNYFFFTVFYISYKSNIKTFLNGPLTNVLRTPIN